MTPPEISKNAIEIHNLSVNYGAVVALNDIQLTLRSSRICGLIGMNGSGKSTLFKSIMGQIKPHSGTILINGETPSQIRKKALVSYVPQSEAVDWDFPLSVREVVMTGRYAHLGFSRRPKKIDKLAVADALERVELSELADRQIGELSGGQKKRAFVARGIAQGASILLLDEPFAGVDKKSEGTITTLLRELANDGAAVVISTHDLHALPSLADEAVLLKNTVLLHDSPQIVLKPENLALAFGLSTGDAHVNF